MSDTRASASLLSLTLGPAGLICAFRFDGGQAMRMHWKEVLDGCGPSGFTWVHMKASDRRMHDWLGRQDHLPETARELLLDRDARPRVLAAGGGVLGVLVDMQMHAPGDSGGRGALRFFMDGNRLITVRHEPLHAPDRLRRAIEQGECHADTVSLFAGLIHCLTAGLAEKVEWLTDQIDDIEESVLSDRQSSDRVALGAARRQLAELRRSINPERTVLSRLLALRQPWIAPGALDELAQAVESLNGVGLTLESLSDRAKLLQEEIASQMSEEMNRNLMLLSVMTAFLMPATLVSGVFGMNVAGLPGLKTETAFWWVVGLMVFLGLATLALLKRLRIW